MPCSLLTHRQTHRQSDYWGHPFRVSGFFPSTYHQGSAQFRHAFGKVKINYSFCLIFMFHTWEALYISFTMNKSVDNILLQICTRSQCLFYLHLLISPPGPRLCQWTASDLLVRTSRQNTCEHAICCFWHSFFSFNIVVCLLCGLLWFIDILIKRLVIPHQHY